MKTASIHYLKNFMAPGYWRRHFRYYDITPQGIRLLDKWTERIKERAKALARFIKIYYQD